MKKLLLFIFIMLLSSLLLAGCKPSENSSPSDPDDGANAPSEPDDESGEVEDENGETTDGKANGLTIVYADTAFKDIIFELYTAADEKYDFMPVVSNDGKEPSGIEIVFGKTSRAISEKAYTLLDRLDRDSYGDVGYLIYTEGGSVAIAFDDDPSGLLNTAEIALDVFIDVCFTNGDMLLLKDTGVITSSTFDLVSYLEVADDREVDKKWLLLEAELGQHGPAIVEALKQFYTLPSDGLVSWFANLYDPETGGYYYSNSARNTETFLPDIESTAQALGFISSSGMLSNYKNNYANALPEDMKAKIVYFLKSLQDQNGFFYHPQWTKELTDSKLSRRARDLGNAVSVLKTLGSAPTYNTPNGDRGDGILADGSFVSKTGLVTPLGGSAVVAVSKVIPTATAVPSHLVDKEAFLNYLDTLDINNKSYSVGNTLTSQKSQIVKRDEDLAALGADYSLMDILINWLNENQYENGLWDEDEDYHAVNGLMKISGVYSAAKVLLPRADKAVRAAIRAMSTEEDADAVTDVYNTWYAVNRVLNHMNSFGTEEDILLASQLRLELYAVAPEAIRQSAIKLSIFRKDDGSFSYTPLNSSANSQGCPVAVPGTNEGDVNATVICTTGILGCIYGSLGISSEFEVPILTNADWVEYRTILTNLGPVMKDEMEDSTDAVTFDDDIIDEAPMDISSKIGSAGYIKVIKDARGDGSVVEINSLSGGADYVQMACTSPSNAARTCNVFEAELCMLSSSSSYPVQIFMGESYMITLRYSGGKVKIVESTSATAKKSRDIDLKLYPELSEWFKLRIEYYVGDAETTRVKIYYNDELAAITDGFYDPDGVRLTDATPTPSSSYGYSRIYILKSSECRLLVDNIRTYKSNDKYKPLGENEKQPPINVDAPEVLPTPPETPVLEKDFDTYYASPEYNGTRYDFTDKITVDAYNAEKSPTGILAAPLSDDSKVSFGADKKSYLTSETGVLAYNMSSADWAGFTIANKGNTEGGEGHTYVFEADFTYLEGTLKEGATDYKILFAGMTSGNEVNSNMAKYTYVSMKDAEGSALLWHNQTFERGVTYNVRMVYVVGGEYKFYVNGVLIESASLSTTKDADPYTYAGFGFYFRNRCDSFWFAFDNVFMANYAPGEAPEAPTPVIPSEPITEPSDVTLPDGVDSYFDYTELSGTRYDFSTEVTLEAYDEKNAPNGIFSDAPLKDTTNALSSGGASLAINEGVLEYVINTESWSGFTIANKGEVAGGNKYTYIFEADITFSGGVLSESGKKYKDFAYMGMTTGNENNAEFMQYSFVSFTDEDCSSITWQGYTFEKDVTYKLRIVIVAGVSYSVYVDGVKVANASYKFDGATPDTYEGFGFYFRKSVIDFKITLDNVYIGNIAPTVVEE